MKHAFDSDKIFSYRRGIYFEENEKGNQMFGVLKGHELKQNPDLMNEIVLAYIGDCVYELYVRNLSLETGKSRTKDLNRLSASFSKAASQADVLRRMEHTFSEQERQIVKRARNKKITSKPKNATPIDYKLATAFEALVGYLYLKGDHVRMEEIIEEALLGAKQEKSPDEPGLPERREEHE